MISFCLGRKYFYILLYEAPPAETRLTVYRRLSMTRRAEVAELPCSKSNTGAREYFFDTSNSRPWRSIGSFIYIGSAGPGPGGRTDGRTGGGRAGGRRADGRTGGRDDFGRQYNDFHRFSQKASKNTVFFCRFASGGSASTDFYRSNEKGVQKMLKIDSVF